MISRLALLFGCLLVPVLPTAAQSTFWLRNTDPSALFLYWTTPDGPQQPSSTVLARLPLAPGGRHAVAPGERVRVVLAPGLTLVGAFVPWSTPIGYLTPIEGGFLTSAEVPARGTLLVDRPTFAAANRGRTLSAPLQAWNLAPPLLTLGRPELWSTVPVQLEWGAGFLPGGRSWPELWPRPRSLQAADREGALWVRLIWGPGTFPATATVSLALRRPGAFLEWPLEPGRGPVWSWVEGQEATAVGWRISGDDLEAWVPWDRLSEPERRAWRSASALWSLIVTEGGVPRVLDLAPTAIAEWP